MGQLIRFPGWTTLSIPVEGVLEGARTCTEVLVLGWEADGTFYAAASVPDAATLLWWLEQFKHKLLAGDYG